MSVSERFEVVKQPALADRFEVVLEPEKLNLGGAFPEEQPDTGLLERLLAIAGKVGAPGTPGYAGPGGVPQAEPQQAQPKGIVQRILDGEAEEREEAAAGGRPEPSIRAATPEEQIDEDNSRYYKSQIGVGLLPGSYPTEGISPEEEPAEITPGEVAEAQLELELTDLVREKGVKGAREFLKASGVLQKDPVVERFFNAVVGKKPGVTEQVLTTGVEAFGSDLAGLLVGLVAPSKITQAAGITTKAAIGARRLGVPGKLAEIGGRAAGTGTTFGIRGAQEVAAQIANDEEVSPEEAAKHIVNYTLFGGGLGAVGTVPQAVLRIPAEGLYGYLTAYLQGATPAEAAFTGALFMGFGLMNKRNLSFELKDAAFARLLRTTEKKLAGEGIPAEAINKLKQDMYRIWSRKVNPTLDDLIKAQDELAGMVRAEPPKPGEVAAKGDQVKVPEVPKKPKAPAEWGEQVKKDIGASVESIREKLSTAEKTGDMQAYNEASAEMSALMKRVGQQTARPKAPVEGVKPKVLAETALIAAEKAPEPSTTAITEEKPPIPPVEAEKGAKEPWEEVYAWLGGKQSWEVTRTEFYRTMPEKLERSLLGPPSHQVDVKNAFQAGKAVPAAVLKDYPDLTPKKTKEPWEMTREKFIDLESEYWKKTEKPESVYKATLGASHHKSVEQALSEGKPIPSEVLAEYPDLAPKEGAAKTSVKPSEDVITEPEGVEIAPDDIITTDLIKGRMIEPGFLGKAKHPGYRVEIITGHEKGKESFIMTEDVQSVEKAKKSTEAPEIERSKGVKSVSDLNLRPSAFGGNVTLQGEFISDGHVMIKRSILDEKRAKRLEEKPMEGRERYVEQAKVKKLWQGYVREAKQEGEILGYSDRSKDYPGAYGEVGGPTRRAYIVNKDDETDIRVFDADKIRMLQSYVGFNKIKISEGKLGVAIFYKDRRAVALLMPVRSEEGVVEIDVPTARRALAGEFAEEGVSKEDAPKVTWLHGQKPGGTATTADIGPDIFYEQELRQAFPAAEASPSEPLGPFAKDIEPRKDIGSDLMEAARMIAAPVRYRKLRASMLGVFRRPDKIELQDIRWIRTLAHELGHAVDYRLTRFPRSVIKRFPDLGVNEMKARAELKRASEYFRPLPEGAKWDRGTSFMRYRAKHTELMADLTGLYMLSPKKAQELAPNVTEALESAIAGNGDVKTAIRTVLDPEQVEFIEKRGRETKTELPPKPEFVGTEADPQIRKEVFDTVKQTSRELEAQLLRTFAFEKRLRKSLSEKERESLTFLIEKIGDPRIEGDTFEKVQGRATPEVRKIAREARYEQELNRQEANKIAQEAGDGPEWIQYIADYVPHFWVVPRKKALEYAGRWRKSTPHAKQRTFPTFADGVKLDWQPVSYDFAYLYSRAAENNFRAAVTRRFARRIKDMRTTGGEPVMVGSLDKAGPDWVKIDHPVLRHVYARRTKGGDLILGEGNAYVHPSIARPVKVLLEKPFGGSLAKFVYAVNAAGKSINVAFSFFHEFSLFESSQAVNARFLNPLRGIFIGPFEARRLGLGFKPHLTHRAGFLLAEKDIYGFVDAAKHGLAIRRSPATIDYARTFLERQLRKLETGTRKIPALSFMTKKLRVMYEAYQRHLWDNVHSGMKLFSYNTLVAETLPDLPADVSVRQAKETIASQVNDAFGGQEFLELPGMHAGKISWEPATVKQIQILHGAMFAPDWTFSNIRVAGRPIVNFRNRIMLLKGIRYWRNMILTLAGTAIILQKMIYEIFKGDDPDMKEWTWQNEPGREWDVDITPIKRKAQKTLGMKVQERRSYAHAGKQAREVLRYFSDFPKGLLQNIGNKSSVLVRMVIEQASGHQAGSGFPMPWMDSGFQDEIEGWKRIIAQGKAAGEHFTPFSWQENNFAFSVPHRKGMSRYRASKHYKDAMMAFADPSWWDKIKGKVSRETQEKALIKFFQEVDVALKTNGQDEQGRKGTFNSARSYLRGRYYGKFFQAIEDQSWKAADDYAVILLNLGATGITASQSATSRGERKLWFGEDKDDKGLSPAQEIFKMRWELRSVFLNYGTVMSSARD